MMPVASRMVARWVISKDQFRSTKNRVLALGDAGHYNAQPHKRPKNSRAFSAVKQTVSLRRAH